MAEWVNRIVGTSEEDPRTLIPNLKNWRKHPKAQADALAKVLDRVGIVAKVMVNDRTGHMVDGHLRVKLAIARGQALVPVDHIDVDEREEALILATLDPVGAMAEADRAMLAETIAAAQDGTDATAALLAEVAAIYARRGDDVAYTSRIVTPIYEPRGPEPDVATLYDTTVTDALLAEIKGTVLPADVRALLTAAAQRHTVLHFDRIADYYAHAEPKVQRLMEASALVIVDAKQAIERGFLALHEGVLEAFHDENPSA